MKINEQHIQTIKELLPEKAQAYLVGGYVRDFLLGIHSFDADYALLGVDTVDFARKFAKKIKGHFVLLDAENEIARVVLQDKITSVDFACGVGKTIEDDLARRDFSINAMAYDIKNETLIDIFGGKKDLEQKTVRIFDEKNLHDDPLRILRAYRFASKYDFEIESESKIFLEQNLKLMREKNIADERIRVEFLKLLEGKNSAKTLLELRDNEFLYEIFEELRVQETIPCNSHHHLDLIHHSIETVRQLEILIPQEPQWVQEYLGEDFVQGVSRLIFLKLAALLHDIGKPQTWEIEPDTGRHRFIRHDEIGAKMALKLLKKLKYGNIQAKYVEKLTRHHIYPSHLLRSDVTEKAVTRMFRRLESETVDIILLAKADRLSARGEEISDEIVTQNLKGLESLLEKYKIAKETLKPLEKLISGHEIMEILSIPEGKKLGEIIKNLNEAQLSGDVSTKEDAISFVKNY